MKFIKKFYESAKEFCIAYPAVLSGYFIYGYLFFCLLQYFFKARYFTPHSSDVIMNIIESFDAFPFMWFLSVALVKVIEVRTKLHQSEEQRLHIEREKQLQQTQLKTLQEVTRSLQHHINNPLAIISLTLGPARRAANDNAEIIQQLDVIDEAASRINTVLADFSKVTEYTVESVGPVVGDIASPNVKN